MAGNGQWVIQRVERQGIPRARAWMNLAPRQCLSAMRQVKPISWATGVRWKEVSALGSIGLVV